MAAMFLLVLSGFPDHDEADLSPNTQVFGCLSCWRSFGAAEFLDSCLRGLIVLVPCIWCKWLFVLDRCSIWE